ncbi:hypothetical protein T10_11 [Trichinella papuae]|uniref:Uncharacterized protein n=1 Tax=Trichinella papuae TaxID=268474 RepID=A0A0V1N825_9BILA|nr:hypothetical protein T10_9769 [Trichinella papuae]KRZ80274.1 hypothetical protein T10_11 [Trichinella papuae]
MTQALLSTQLEFIVSAEAEKAPVEAETWTFYCDVLQNCRKYSDQSKRNCQSPEIDSVRLMIAPDARCDLRLLEWTRLTEYLRQRRHAGQAMGAVLFLVVWKKIFKPSKICDEEESIEFKTKAVNNPIEAPTQAIYRVHDCKKDHMRTLNERSSLIIKED